MISGFFFVAISVAAALRLVERIVLCLYGEAFSEGLMQGPSKVLHPRHPLWLQVVPEDLCPQVL